MSKIREAKLTGVNAATLVAGARALGYKATDTSIDFKVTRGVFQILKTGKLQGDYDYLEKVAGVPMPKKIEDRPQAVIGVLAQAGTVARIAEHLTPQGWTVQANHANGMLTALRGTEKIEVTADRKGQIKTEGHNFAGTSCNLVLDQFMGLLGSHTVTNETQKLEEQQVIRTVI